MVGFLGSGKVAWGVDAGTQQALDSLQGSELPGFRRYMSDLEVRRCTVPN